MTADESRDAQSGVAEELAEALHRDCCPFGKDHIARLVNHETGRKVKARPECFDIASIVMEAGVLGPLLGAERAKALREAADEAEALRSFAHGKNPTSEAHLIGYGTARRVIVRLLRDRADREQS